MKIKKKIQINKVYHFHLWHISTIVPLIFALWKEVREFKDKWWGSMLRLGLASSSDFRIWLSGSK